MRAAWASLPSWLRARTSPWARFAGWLVLSIGGIGAFLETDLAAHVGCLVVPVAAGVALVPAWFLFLGGLHADLAADGQLAGSTAPWTLTSARRRPFLASVWAFAILEALAFSALGGLAYAGLTVDVGPWAHFALGAACALAAGFAGARVAPRGVHLDGDVLRIERGLGWTTIRLNDVARARVVERPALAVEILFADGRIVRAPASADRRRDADALVETLYRVRGGAWVERKGEIGSALLDRRGETFAAWRARIEAMASGDGYRGATVPLDTLEAVVGSVDAPVERRIAAAMALRAIGATRTAAVAEWLPAGRLRMALESIDAGTPDEAAIDEALATAEARVAPERRDDEAQDD